MKIPRTERSPIIYLLLFAVLCLFIFLVSFQKQHWDTDIFWALKSGEWIITNFRAPLTDPFSFTFADKEWIDFTWGFQVIVYLVYTYLGGWLGLFILQFITLLATFYVLYCLFMLISEGKSWLAIALLYLVFAATYPRFMIRPHIFVFLFISTYFYLLVLSEKQDRLKWLILLLPLQVVWANIHSSSILGIFIVGSFAICAFVEEIRGGLGRASSSYFKRILVVSLLVVAVSFINPYSWKLVLFPFVHQGGNNPDALRYILEWQPFALTSLLYFMPVPLYSIAFKILLFGSFVAIVLNRRNLKIRYFILLLPILFVSLQHVRMLSVFAVFAAPVLVMNLASYMRSARRRSGFLEWAAGCIILGTIVIFMVGFFAGNYKSYFGLGMLKGHFSEGIVSFVKNERVRGNFFNEYDHGGYLLFNDIRVSLDSRTPTVYSPDFYWMWRRAREKQKYFDRFTARNAMDVAIVLPTIQLCDRLWKDKDWQAVAFDDVSALFLKNVASNADIISKWGLKSLSPCDLSAEETMTAQREGLLKMRTEAKRMVDYYQSVGLGDTVSRTHSLLARVETALGGEYLQGAVANYRRAIDVRSRQRLHYELAFALGKSERFDEALVHYKKVERNMVKATMAIGLIYHDRREFGKAYEYLSRYVDKLGDRAKHPAYKGLGNSCLETGRFDCAAFNLKKYAFIVGEVEGIADIYYRIGIAYFGMDKYKQGGLYFKKSIDLDKGYLLKLEALQASFKDKGWKSKAIALDGLILVRR